MEVENDPERKTMQSTTNKVVFHFHLSSRESNIGELKWSAGAWLETQDILHNALQTQDRLSVWRGLVLKMQRMPRVVLITSPGLYFDPWAACMHSDSRR